jgi:hypothetical protein
MVFDYVTVFPQGKTMTENTVDQQSNLKGSK